MLLRCLLGFGVAVLAVPFQGVSEVMKQKRTIPSISNSQSVLGEVFIGNSVTAHPLQPKPTFKPLAMNLHQDGGNSGISDNPGPLGNHVNVTTAAGNVHMFLWTKSGQIVAGYTKSTSNGSVSGFAAIDENLNVQATWFPSESDQILNPAYTELVQDTDQIVTTTKQGLIYVVQLSFASDGQPSLDLNETINLTSTLKPGEVLMNAMYDTDHNLWFSSGGIRSNGGEGDAPQNSSTIGYVESGRHGGIHSFHIENQMIENGIAVSGTTTYVVTGPSGLDDTANAKGYMFAFGPGPGNSLTTHWKAEYDAGSTKKPGAFARGSGATPALLGNDYVAITDNANERVHLVIYRQTKAREQVVCKVPLFKSNQSNVDIAAMVQKEGDTYGVFLCNDYNTPTLYYGDAEINGDWNNLTQMAPGVTRINVNSAGNCEVAWEQEQRISSVPLLSTKTGLVYAYTQSVEYSLSGLWEWYVLALDWQTGEEVWRLRTGAGGTYNDNYQPGSLGPDGTFYQGVVGGVVLVKDE